jgi:hypothetical protein
MRIWGALCLTFVLLFTLAELSSAQDTNFPVGPQYLITSGAPLLQRPIATPSMSFDSGLTQPQVTEVAAQPTSNVSETTYDAVSAILDAEKQMALVSIYYGYPTPSVVELAFSEAGEEETVSMPASIFESGVVELTSAQALRERGYGVTVAEAAARSWSHKSSERHVYTNDDVERMRPRD